MIIITKFYRTLISILDLDQQKMIDKFKYLANLKRTSYPPYYKKYAVTSKTYLDFQTLTYNNKNSITGLSLYGFDKNSIQRIQNIFDKPYYAVNLYQIRKNEPTELQLIMGVAYSIQGKIYISFVNASSHIKLYQQYCTLKDEVDEETCKDDPVCVEECNAYKRLVRNPNKLEKDIPGFNRKNYNNNLKQISLADVTNKVSDILNQIKF